MAKKTIKDIQSRKYQLTINNPQKDGFTHDKIKELCICKFKSFQYATMCDEIGGKNKTPHTHVFLCFNNPVRVSSIKNKFPTAHIEVAKGSIDDNIQYLKKSGKWEDSSKAETSVKGTYEEVGERPPENLGKRKDLEDLYHMIVDEELSNAEIIKLNQDYIMEIDKLDKIRTMHLQDKYRNIRRVDIEVTYVYGITGSGKSRDILDTFGDDNVYRVTDYDHPFDQYQCEPVIVFEEFRSSLPLKEMLNYLDIYPIALKARYANKFACYTKIFLATNISLEAQYTELQKVDKESWRAFLRRIHKVKEYTKTGIREFNSIDEYMNRFNTIIPVKELTEEEQLEIPFSL